MRVGYVHLGQATTERPKMRNWRSSVHHDNKRAFPANEIDKELKECVNRKSLSDESCVSQDLWWREKVANNLVNVAEGVNPE